MGRFIPLSIANARFNRPANQRVGWVSNVPSAVTRGQGAGGGVSLPTNPLELGSPSATKEYWPMGETSGTRAGLGTTGVTLTEAGGTISSTTGFASDTAASFDGTNKALTMGDAAISRLNQGTPLTIAFRAYFGATSNLVLGRNEFGGGFDWDLIFVNNDLFLRTFNAGGADSSLTVMTAPSTSAWYHVVLVIDPDGLTAARYVRAGTKTFTSGSTSINTPRYTADVDCFVGGGGATQQFPMTGRMQDLVFARETWTAKERYRYLMDFARLKQIVWDGNSFVAGNGASTAANRMINVLNTSATEHFLVRGYGVSGQQTSEMIADAVAQIDPLVSDGDTNWCLFTEGTNAIVFGASAATAYSQLVAYGVARKAAGWKTGLSDVIVRPGQFDAAQEARRVSLNALLAADFPTATANPAIWLPNSTGATYANFLYRPSVQSEFADASASGLTGGDGIHPNDTGHAAWAAGMLAGIEIVETALGI